MNEQSKGRILIVDDQDGIRESMSDALSMEGYEIHTVDDGYKAIEKARQISFDVAFLDIKMPGINGVEAYREIKKLSPETVVFMITACAEQDLIKQALDEGAYACIHKPFDMEKIIETVHDTQRRTAVLILEHGLNIRESLRQTLIDRGFKVVAVTDEQTAAQSHNRKPADIVLIDSDDVMDEATLIAKAREVTGEENPKIIVINQCTVNDRPGEVIIVGTKKYQNNPVDISTLEKTINELLRKK